MKKMYNKRNLRNQKGITLIALVITIIVLIILAAISITAILGENGILNHAEGAKDESTIAGEKELIILAMNEWKIQKVTQKDKTFATVMQEIMQKNDNVQSVEKITDNEVNVTCKSGNIYYLNQEEEVEKICKEENPGVLEDIGNNRLQISSIEDLLALAYNVNSEAETYEGKTIELGRDLDFKKDHSYKNPNAKYILDDTKGYIKDESGTSIKELLIDETGKGFIPIGVKGSFKGNFDGKGNKLKNIYINSDSLGRIIC